MTNPAHKQKLCQGQESWNAWRAENPAIIPDLCGLTLPLNSRNFISAGNTSIDLSWAQMDGADLRFTMLTAAKLNNASLAGADFTSARLTGADFRCADLTAVTFKAADVEGARFDGAILRGASLAGARNLTQEQISLAIGNKRTLLPDGLTVPPDWLAAEGEESARPEPAQAPARPRKLPDLYAVLGLTPAATAQQIQDAYRSMAKALHPDRHPGNHSIGDAFKCASSAAEILLDPRQRQLYDRRELDVHGNRLPESIAQEAAGRRHGVFAIAFLIGLMALPLTYLAVVWSQSLAHREIAGSISKEPAERTVEKLSQALQEEKGLTAPAQTDTPLRLEPVDEKPLKPELDDSPASPGVRKVPVALESPENPDAVTPPAAEMPATRATEEAPAPSPVETPAPDPSGPLTSIPVVSPAAPARESEAPAGVNAPEVAAIVPDRAETSSAAVEEAHGKPGRAEEEALMKKGMYLLKGGNVNAARLCFENLAMRGSADGAFAMGQSYDPIVLETLGIAGGVEADATKSKEWHNKAVKLRAYSNAP
jgi:hypothetical protein